MQHPVFGCVHCCSFLLQSVPALSPNSGQVAEDGPRNPASVLASEHKQQSPTSTLTLPQQQDDQIGLQTQSATSLLDQTEGAQVQYQPSGKDQASLPMRVQVQYRPSGIDLTPSAEEASNSTAIVDAQMTPPTSRDDDGQMQDAPRTDDAPMPEALAVHDIATPRRQVGGRCRKWVIGTQQTSAAHSRLQTNKNMLPAVCVVSNLATEKRVCNSGATETLIVLTSTLNVSIGASSSMITSCSQSIPRTRTQLKPSYDSATVSSARLQTQRSPASWQGLG